MEKAAVLVFVMSVCGFAFFLRLCFLTRQSRGLDPGRFLIIHVTKPHWASYETEVNRNLYYYLYYYLVVKLLKDKKISSGPIMVNIGSAIDNQADMLGFSLTISYLFSPTHFC